MAEQSAWLANNQTGIGLGVFLQSESDAYAGHLRKARELTRVLTDHLMSGDSKEAAAKIWDNAALREAMFGNATQARQAAAEALKVAPDSQRVEIEAALAFAMVGDTARAKSLAQDLDKRFPLHTQVQSLWLPTIDAQLALSENEPAVALDRLRAASVMELGYTPTHVNISCLYAVYVRAEAYLANGEGSAAAREFQKILDHSGIVWNCPTGALARLGLARSNSLQARTDRGVAADAARHRAYDAYQEFFDLWEHADPDIPILQQAKAEYAKLQ
jgi:eukaryotic-like serine/threonine-protein kinase